MPSSQASGDRSDPPEEDGSEEDAPETGTAGETQTCPNCGHDFTGTYCPECGQKADSSVSITGVVGGFFRELVDVEHGFWPTFVGLTVRPGTVLRQYLRGVRKGLASPGRYLLVAVVVEVSVDRVLAWTGATRDPLGVDSVSDPSADGGAESVEGLEGTFEAAYEPADILFKGPQARIIAYLLLISLLTLLLYRLFESQFGRRSEALAVGTFLVGHLIFLTGGARLLYKLPVSLYTGGPVDNSTLLILLILTGYAGFASYGCFGPGWKAAWKGAFAIVWGVMEVFSIALIGVLSYTAWLMHTYPDKYLPAEDASQPETVFLAVAIMGALCVIPLLLHAGLEAYYRYW